MQVIIQQSPSETITNGTLNDHHLNGCLFTPVPPGDVVPKDVNAAVATIKTKRALELMGKNIWNG